MKLFVKIALILIIAGNLAVYPYQACAAHYHNCLCCKNVICTCDGSGQSTGHNAKSGSFRFQCDDCKQKQNTQETFLITESSSEIKKKPVLFASHTILPDNTLVLGVPTEASLYNQHLLSLSSLFLINESLRL